MTIIIIIIIIFIYCGLDISEVFNISIFIFKRCINFMLLL